MMGPVVGFDSEVVDAEVGIEDVEEDVCGRMDIGDEEEDECRELIVVVLLGKRQTPKTGLAISVAASSKCSSTLQFIHSFARRDDSFCGDKMHVVLQKSGSVVQSSRTSPTSPLGPPSVVTSQPQEHADTTADEFTPVLAKNVP